MPKLKSAYAQRTFSLTFESEDILNLVALAEVFLNQCF